MGKKHARMAIAYDFDGTLAPGNMQEHQFLPDIGMTPKKFWAEVKSIASAQQADEVLVYMNLMLRKAEAAHVPVRRSDFKSLGKSIKLFDGVAGWFGRMNAYAKKRSVELQHVLISSGNEEIFEGTPIRKRFSRVYASKYLFDENGVAKWPALAINYTTKTQYLFRINKDAHDLSDSGSVNKFVPKSERPVPFENIVFIGDGATDIPCFRLVRDQGGLSVAVYTPHKKGGKSKAESYLKDGRVHSAVPANYKDGSELDRLVKAQIDHVAARHVLRGLLQSP